MPADHACPGLLCLSELSATDVGLTRRLVERGANRLSLLPKLGAAFNQARMLLLELGELHTDWLGCSTGLGYPLLNFGELRSTRHKTNLSLVTSSSPLSIPAQNMAVTGHYLPRIASNLARGQTLSRQQGMLNGVQHERGAKVPTYNPLHTLVAARYVGSKAQESTFR